MGGICHSKEKNEAQNKNESVLLGLTEQEKFNRNSKTLFKMADINFTMSDFVVEKLGKVNKDYTLLNPPIGKGAFGEVRKAIHKKSGIMRAIKIINKSNTSEEEQNKLINEVQILKELDHPNIIKIIEFYQDEGYFYIITDLCTGGELFDKIIEQKSFSEKNAHGIFQQILSAVFYCHGHKIVHRDLKPENLLYESENDNSALKVIDFGTSRSFDPNIKMNQKFGTPYYIAPEVLKKKYDEKCDIWSCGVILFILLSGTPPFNGKNDKIIMENVAKGTYSFSAEEWKNISTLAKDFIKKMLELDPLKRYSAEQALNDPWMKKYADQNEIDIPLMHSALNNIRNFRSCQKLQEAIWMFFINYLATKEEKSQLLKTFQDLDLNKDGQLSKEELIIGYSKIMNAAQAEEEVNRILKVVDKNNSGTIDYTEFVIATINKEHLLSKQRLETAFKMFDKDGNGILSLDEIKEVFKGKKINDEAWKAIIKEVDVNGDGKISNDEFKKMMLKFLVKEDPMNNEKESKSENKKLKKKTKNQI